MSRAIVTLMVLGSIPVVPFPARAQSPARDNPTQNGGTASIRGRVVDAASGRALSRVEMRAGPNTGQAGNRIVMTDGEGRYEIKGLPSRTTPTFAANSARDLARQAAR